MVLTSNGWYSYKKRDKERHRHAWEKACEEGGRNQSDVSTSHRKSSIASNHQKLEETKKDSFLETAGGAWPYGHFDFRLLTSRTVRA